MSNQFEAVQKLLRDMLQGSADGSVGQFSERSAPRVAVPCQLGIEWNGPEARDSQAGRDASERWGGKQRLDGVAVAAVVAAHVLDVTEEAMGPALNSVEGSLRQSGGHRSRDDPARHLGRDRHEQEGTRGPGDVEG